MVSLHDLLEETSLLWIEEYETSWYKLEYDILGDDNRERYGAGGSQLAIPSSSFHWAGARGLYIFQVPYFKKISTARIEIFILHCSDAPCSLLPKQAL